MINNLIDFKLRLQTPSVLKTPCDNLGHGIKKVKLLCKRYKSLRKNKRPMRKKSIDAQHRITDITETLRKTSMINLLRNLR